LILIGKHTPLLRGKCKLSTVVRSQAITILRLALLVAVVGMAAFAQEPFAATQQLSPNDAIFGFENVGAWQVSVGPSNYSVALSPQRTQGVAALSVTNPGNNARLISLPVASSASQLAALAGPGAVFAVDLRFPVGKQTPSSLNLSLTSPSRGLNKISLGKVSLSKLRAGTFQTILFPVSDQARKALAGAAFNDLTFQLDMAATSASGVGEFLFDNLRLRSTMGVTADATTQPPAGYGGSADFDVDLSVPPAAPLFNPVSTALPIPGAAEVTFEVGPVQIPDRFHLKSGTAGPGTSVKLELGYSSLLIGVTCLYLPDTLDPSNKSYVFSTCTGGPQPGDLTGASWGRLQIVNGLPPMRLRAQLARRPLGDQTGSSLLPPMPTFWGDEDGCIPAPVSGQPITLSQSCSDNRAQTSKIISDYFTLITNSNPANGWIVTPTPEFAKRHGDGMPPPDGLSANRLSSLSANQASGASPPFSILNENREGHMNNHGLFDAYWKWTADVSYSQELASGRAQTNAQTDFQTNLVALGFHIPVVVVNAHAATDTGRASPPVPPSFELNGGIFVLGGIESITFSQNQLNQVIPLYDPPPLTLGEINYYIFAIKVSVGAHAELALTGGMTPAGLGVILTPGGAIQVHIFGGIDVILASAGVDATVDALNVKAPISAAVNWNVEPAIDRCITTVTGGVTADLNISSGGGKVSLVASVGPCPLCYDTSFKLFDWPPIAQAPPIRIANEQFAIASFPLPESSCTGNAARVTIQTPVSDFAPVYGAVDNTAAGIATSLNNIGGVMGASLTCSNSTYTWTVDAPDSIIGSGCDSKVRFANTVHVAQLHLKVDHNVTDANGRTLIETGSTTKAVNISVLQVGVTITEVFNLDTNLPERPFRPLTASSGPAVKGYRLTATYLPPPNSDPAGVQFRWYTLHNGVTTDISCNTGVNLGNCVPTGNLTYSDTQLYWNPPIDNNDTNAYTVTFKAISKATNAVLGQDSFDTKFWGVVN